MHSSSWCTCCGTAALHCKNFVGAFTDLDCAGPPCACCGVCSLLRCSLCQCHQRFTLYVSPPCTACSRRTHSLHGADPASQMFLPLRQPIKQIVGYGLLVTTVLFVLCGLPILVRGCQHHVLPMACHCACRSISPQYPS